MKVLRVAYRFLVSYGLSCILFFFLLVLTLLGTLEQVEHGLYATQKKYFESLFLVHEFFGKVPVVLPGARLLLILLFVNLLLGALLQARKGWSKAGILIAHFGILLLLVGSFITYEYSLNGHVTLYENERSNVFQSYQDWEFVITERSPDGAAREHVISAEGLEKLKPGQEKVFHSDALPFDVAVREYAANAVPQPGGFAPKGIRVVDGFYLASRPLEPEAERNVAGARVALMDKDGQESREAILWGMARAPYAIESGGRVWSIDLRKRQWPLPFTIALDKFTRELHPRTNMPKTFMSEVTKIEDGSEQKLKVTMNEPLRHKGFTFYQASWGPPNARPGDRLYSTFAVVKNPADSFPLYACLIITFGLVVHFLHRLVGHLRAEGQKAS